MCWLCVFSYDLWNDGFAVDAPANNSCTETVVYPVSDNDCNYSLPVGPAVGIAISIVVAFGLGFAAAFFCGFMMAKPAMAQQGSASGTEMGKV